MNQNLHPLLVALKPLDVDQKMCNRAHFQNSCRGYASRNLRTLLQTTTVHLTTSQHPSFHPKIFKIMSVKISEGQYAVTMRKCHQNANVDLSGHA